MCQLRILPPTLNRLVSLTELDWEANPLRSPPALVRKVCGLWGRGRRDGRQLGMKTILRYLGVLLQARESKSLSL